MAATYTHVLVLDFDGTVCLGDGPVLAYARLLDEALATDESAAGHESPGIVERTVQRFLDGDAVADVNSHADTVAGVNGSVEAVAAANSDGAVASVPGSADAVAAVSGSVDGYEACARLGRALGATDVQLDAAYAGSRAELASGAITTWAPPGLRELLQQLPATTRRVLVTNAPAEGVLQQLDLLGLARSFDEVVTSANKPAGMGAIVQGLLEPEGLAGQPSALLSVGDIWRNDLAPAAALGCETALIERLPGPADARPTYRAGTVEQLYPVITAWAAR